MDLFLDTCVLVGYALKTDELNIPSFYVIENKLKKYASYNVKREFINVYERKTDVAYKALDEIIINLTNEKIPDTKKLLGTLNQHLLRPMIESLVEKNLSMRDPKVLATKLRAIRRDFESEIHKNISKLKNCIECIDLDNHFIQTLFQNWMPLAYIQQIVQIVM